MVNFIDVTVSNNKDYGYEIGLFHDYNTELEGPNKSIFDRFITFVVDVNKKANTITVLGAFTGRFDHLRKRQDYMIEVKSKFSYTELKSIQDNKIKTSIIKSDIMEAMMNYLVDYRCTNNIEPPPKPEGIFITNYIGAIEDIASKIVLKYF